MEEKRYCLCGKELTKRQKRFCSNKCSAVWKAQDPKWQMRNKEIRERVYKDPELRKKQKNGIIKKYQDPKYIKKIKESNQKKAQDPKWLKKVKKANQKKAQDPKWLKKQKEAAQKRAQDPLWIKKMREVGQKRSQDPEYIKKISGLNNYQWNNGSSAIPYAPEFIYSGVREAVDQLFNYTCCECHNPITDPKKLHDHHINYNKWATGHIDNPFLLLLLCDKCHSKTNGNKKNREKWQKHFMDMLSERFKKEPFFELVYKRDIMYRNEGKPKMEIPGERYGHFLIKSIIKNKDHDLHLSFIPPYYTLIR